MDRKHKYYTGLRFYQFTTEIVIYSHNIHALADYGSWECYTFKSDYHPSGVWRRALWGSFDKADRLRRNFKDITEQNAEELIFLDGLG